jgi:hypothetical protein
MPLNAPTTGPNAPAPHGTQETIKDTLISIMIAFTMAFVFRGFVVEAFVIPTGSMAPTLMGAHQQVRSSETGQEWPLGAWEDRPARSTNYIDPQPAFVSQDPISGQPVLGATDVFGRSHSRAEVSVRAAGAEAV